MTDKNPREAVILGAARTPQGKFLGALAPLSAAELGQTAFKAAVERSGIDANNVNEVIVGNVISAGVGQALPRQISIGAGVPDTVGGVAVNKVCGSGLKSVMLAATAIKADEGDLFLAGGVESMSNAPYLDDHMRQGNKYGAVQLRDSLQTDGLWCSFEDWAMGNAAEFIGKQLEITREEMDEFAFRSHQLAHQATESGKFNAEIAPVTIQSRKGNVTITTDEPIRPDTSLEALASLRPAFEKDGQVTAGNAPGMNDGASAVVVASRAYAEQNGHQPIARIVAFGQAALDPKWIFYAPVKAIPVALQKAGWTVDDVDLFEINEAFASQVLADMRGLERDGYAVPMEKVNVHGGAIALGHPLGSSGSRVLVTLIHALQDRGLKRGVAALCLGGGEAVAMAVELE
ncbi:acetyl-CoA C-acetyltransferase [Phototrophicus methaneseepsis]|uniref:acetyl-CoA C-acetyltransferase n=1 Tax=Phototrophicus methaneseepsis TaxID=2710758 RepID=A0A7S8E765_9CHLR|nr:acetyl-CoA C-acetyltransferase [Phototrophicus methaneseepsis]QPC81590.1 acetyl-CoA C-acetyltransferase [Phototrophicus methaneseepsis]